MAFSPLIDRVLTTKKYSSRNGKKITRVIVHHWAGRTGGIERLVHSSDRASVNYLILSTGELIGSVDELYRAWTSGSAAADRPSITIEVQNETLGPEWRVSDKAIATLIRLIADIATRHGWKTITRTQVRGHREYQATACPGPHLYPQLSRIAAEAEKVRKGGLPVSGGGQSAPKPSTSKPASGKSVAALAAEVIAGKHGTGDVRKRALGGQYAAVQAEVNRQLAGKKAPAKPAPKPAAKPAAKPAGKTVSQLADEVLAGAHGSGDARKRSLGARYAAVQAEVNRQLGAKAAPKPAAKSVTTLATEVIAGKHGTGNARRKALGGQYAAVQAEVNRRLKGK